MAWPAAPSGASARVAVATGLVAAVALGVLAARHPEVRFVDVLGFAARARRLWEGAEPGVRTLDGGDWVNGLYPVGYPLVLLAGRLAGLDVLGWAKALSVLAGAGLVAGVSRSLGVGAGVFLLGQLGMLTAGATEGTDLPAAALTLGAVLVAARVGESARPDRTAVVAGALLGLACLTRYTAVAAVPVVLGLGWRGARGLVPALLLTTAPHWAVALWTGASPWPDQSQNLAIAAGHPTALWSVDTLARWPTGFGRALLAAGDLPAAVGAAGLVVGVARRDRRAVALLGLALAHLALLGVAFANPRLTLPATLAAALGAAWLVPTRWLALAGVAVGLWRLGPALAEEGPGARVAAPAAAAGAVDGPCLATSPWFHQRRDGWLVPSIQLSGLAGPGLDPPALRALAQAHGAGCVALDTARTRPAFPRLDPLLGAGPVEGFTLVDRSPGWRVWKVE